jgi:hypothetical protein
LPLRFSLPIADCRLAIEKALLEFPPLSIGNQKSAIPARHVEASIAEIFGKKWKISGRLRQPAIIGWFRV